MEVYLKEKLQASVFKKVADNIQGGCISNTAVYMVDDKKVFVKSASYREADKMFYGEYQSLKAIKRTQTVYVPEPIILVEQNNGSSAIVLEFLDLHRLSKQATTLGSQIARLHLHNIELEKSVLNNEKFVGRSNPEETFTSNFGFHAITCCGKFQQDNEWCESWIEFYAKKLDDHVKRIEQSYNNRTVGELWSSLQLKLPSYFEGLDIKPSLLHGDMWNGNVGEHQNKPVIFDPSSFYGHHEYDLAIADMFGGLPKPFWSAYHNSIPKADGWDRRHRLYILFHQLNHWLHFGSSYQECSLSSLRNLSK